MEPHPTSNQALVFSCGSLPLLLGVSIIYDIYCGNMTSIKGKYFVN